MMSKRYDSDRFKRTRFNNIAELHNSLTQFVIQALTTGKGFTLKYSDAATEDEVDQLRLLAQTRLDDIESSEDFGKGMYL